MQYLHHSKKTVWCNTLIKLTLNLLNFFVGFFCRFNSKPRSCASKASSSNAKWAWKCNGRKWMGSWRLKKVLQGECMHALVFMRPSGCFIDTWTKHMAFKCNSVDLGIHLLILGVLSNKTTLLWMLNNLHVKQKWNEKKAFDQVKEKKEFKWDKFQTQAQQM